MNPSSAASCKVNELYFKTYGAEIDKQNMEYLNSLLAAKSESDTKQENKSKKKKKSFHHMRTKSTIPVSFQERTPPSPPMLQMNLENMKIQEVLVSPGLLRQEKLETPHRFSFPTKNERNMAYYRSKVPDFSMNESSEQSKETTETCIGISGERKLALEKEEFLNVANPKPKELIEPNWPEDKNKKSNGLLSRELDQLKKPPADKFGDRVSMGAGSQPGYPTGKTMQGMLLSPQKLTVDVGWVQKRKPNQKDFNYYHSRKHNNSQHIDRNAEGNEQTATENQNFLKIASHRSSVPQNSGEWEEKNEGKNTRNGLTQIEIEDPNQKFEILEENEKTETFEEPVQMITNQKLDFNNNSSLNVDDHDHNPSLVTVTSPSLNPSNCGSTRREKAKDQNDSYLAGRKSRANSLRKSVPVDCLSELDAKWENPLITSPNQGFLDQIKTGLDYFSGKEVFWKEMMLKHTKNKLVSPQRHRHLETNYQKSTVMLKKLSFENLNLKKKLDFYEQNNKAMKHQNHELLKRLQIYYSEKESLGKKKQKSNSCEKKNKALKEKMKGYKEKLRVLQELYMKESLEKENAKMVIQCLLEKNSKYKQKLREPELLERRQKASNYRSYSQMEGHGSHKPLSRQKRSMVEPSINSGQYEISGFFPKNTEKLMELISGKQAFNSSESDLPGHSEKYISNKGFPEEPVTTPQEEKLKQILKRNEFKEKGPRHSKGRPENRMGERNYSIPLMMSNKEEINMEKTSHRGKRKANHHEELFTQSQVYEFLRRQKPYSKKQKLLMDKHALKSKRNPMNFCSPVSQVPKEPTSLSSQDILNSSMNLP